MHDQTFLIIGEVFVDTHLDIVLEKGPLVRLGGIFHSARAFSSLEANYALAYYAPDYLQDDINIYSLKLNSKGCFKLGSINNAPNVLLINESKELSNQGYYNILKDQANFVENNNILQVVENIKPTDILIFPGRYNTNKIIKSLCNYKGKIHIDFHYDYENILNDIAINIETIILSTSSTLFREQCKGTLNCVLDYFKKYDINNYLIKENRGGAYCYQNKDSKVIESPSYYVPTMHSVGVGDVYNSIFIYDIFDADIKKRMCLASLCAAKYAETMCFNKYSNSIKMILQNTNELVSLEGTRLSWEERSKKNIYLAAPDFPSVDTTLLEKLTDSLKYHNFIPRLPIKENGLVQETTSLEEELKIYNKDLQLIYDCDLLIAVLLFNDPGTLVELGVFKQTGKPTIIFDPFNLCKNMFVRNSVNYLCKTIEEVINATYFCLRRGTI